MKKLKIKSKKRNALDVKIYEMVYRGWTVTKTPAQNWFGKWIAKLEKV